MFSWLNKNSIPYLQSSGLAACDFLAHAFCTREGGVSEDDYQSLNMSFREGDEEFHVLQNWNKLAGSFGIPMENFLVLNQVHRDGILVIPPRGEYFTSREGLDYDAIVTNRTHLAICIKTADCAPIFVVDPENKVIAAVHAGWRGTAAGISAKVVRLMQNQYGSRPSALLAAIGPSIGRCCYEVDEPAAAAFCSHKNAKAFLLPGKRKDRWMLDLAQANRGQLAESGVPDAGIDVSGLCTVCRQDAFFSHRGSGGVTGRQINFLMLKGDPFCKALFVNEDFRQVH